MPVHSHDDPTDLNGDALSLAIHAREFSCREVMAAYLDRIQRLNPLCNAIVNLAPEDRLLAQADACDAELARGMSRGWLHGMPQAIKDTGHALGFPSTLGCTVLKDVLPAQDSLMAARMKAAGCIVLGKTNIPEFALGSHTVNRLFGPTPNAWDPAVSAGGSSGGAAVALAQRLLPVADGSDFMGSLRNPAAWNHVFGMRPSQGRVPGWPKPEGWVSQLATEGPMARTVRDLAQLLSIQAGWDARVPLSLGDEPGGFLPPPDEADHARTLRGLRIGWLADLQGHLAFEPGILPVCEQALHSLVQAGAELHAAVPGFEAERVWQAWRVWRHALVAPAIDAVLARPGAREQLKPEALWEHAQAQTLSASDLMTASTVRTAYYQRLLGLFEQFDVLALPAAQVWPFPLAQDWPHEIAGRTMDTYHRWMEVTLYATFAGLPAISLPAGFDVRGRWPMGVQLIGRPRGDAALLRVAAAYEALHPEMLQRRPAEPGTAA